MQFLDSYLSEVALFLPVEGREDILAELKTSIEEQVADHALASGREAGPEDEATVLRRFGHPLRVAASYQPNRYLIGPALFPVFVRALTVSLTLMLAIQLVLALVASLTSGFTTSPVATLFSLLDTALLVTAIVVAVFAVLEFSGEHLDWYDHWRPESLRGGRAQVIDRGDLATNMITEGIFLLWWNDALIFSGWLPLLGEDVHLSLSGAWSQLYWPLNIVFGAFFLLHVVVLLRGLWHRSTLLAELALGVAALGIAIVLLMGGDLVETTGAGEHRFLDNLQRTTKIALVVVAGFIAWDSWKALRGLRRTMGRGASD